MPFLKMTAQPAEGACFALVVDWPICGGLGWISHSGFARHKREIGYTQTDQCHP